jgi:hypothetical protein
MLFSRMAGVREHTVSCIVITAKKCTTWLIVQAFYRNDNYAALERLFDQHVWRNHSNPVPLAQWHQNLDDTL